MKTKPTPPATVAQVSRDIRQCLITVARTAGRDSQFIQRQVKLDGATFVETLVLGWLSNPQATLEELAQTALSLGVTISAQGLDQRFTAPAAACLKQVLGAAVAHRLQASGVEASGVEASLLDRFHGVYVRDSTVVNLPAALHTVWHGCGGRAGMTPAALKVQWQYDLTSGEITDCLLQDGRAQDRDAPSQHTPLPAGALRLADLGYFSLEVLAEQPDVYFLVRPQSNVVVFDAEGHSWHLHELLAQCTDDELDLPVHVGRQQRVPGRLLARRAPPQVAQEHRRRLKERARKKGTTLSVATLALADWLLFITNVPVEMLTLAEAFTLARCRWQIEWLFKRWKSYGRLDEWRSTKPWRILCEVYAKLLGLVLQHWLCLPMAWRHLDRSLVKAAQTIQKFALALASTLVAPRRFQQTLAALQRCLAAGCRMNRSVKAPRTFQLLEGLA